jgi:hypothetical protein
MEQKPPTQLRLTPDEAAELRSVAKAEADARRRAELAMARARLALMEAADAKIAVIDALALKYGVELDNVSLEGDLLTLAAAPPAAA